MTIEKNIWADIQDGVTQGLAAAELVNDNKRAVNEVIDVVNPLVDQVDLIESNLSSLDSQVDLIQDTVDGLGTASTMTNASGGDTLGTASTKNVATEAQVIAGTAGVLPDAEQVRRNHVAQVATITDLRALEPAFDGQQVSVVNAGMFVSDLEEWIPKNSEGITVSIPSDYATMQEAIDYLSNFKPARGFTINLMIESGHQPETGVSVSNGDYGYFLISSEDANVTVAPSFVGKFLSATNARAPILNCLVDMQGLGTDGYYIVNTSQGIVNPGCGVINSGGSGCIVQSGSYVRAVGSVFNGSARHGFGVNSGSFLHANDAQANNSGWSGLSCTKASKAVFENSSATGCGAAAESGDPQGGIKGSYASEVNARGAVVTGSFDFGVRSDNNSRVEARDVDASNATVHGFNAIRGSEIFALRGVADNCGVHGFLATGGSRVVCDQCSAVGCGTNGIRSEFMSFISAKGATIENSGQQGARANEMSQIHLLGAICRNNAGADVQCNRGSQIGLANCTTTSGSPSISDTNVSNFNVISSANGIVWSD